MRRSLGIAFLGIVVISQAGCGTALNFWSSDGHGYREDYGQMGIYGGVVIDAQALSEAPWPWEKLWALLVLTVEFPLSLVMDTATLPVTIPVTLSR
jgi:uncharacterized protein YceK